MVSVVNGEKASFWELSWLSGQAPMYMFPNLYKLAWRKKRKVKEELTRESWTRALWRMQTVEDMASFVN
jgi:hypothetical protein